jgi:dGTPase
MREHGGFEHNLQSLRVVDALEIRYPAFDGLNLSFETREGILKHCSRRNAERLVAVEPDGPARRFLDGGQPSLEAQLVNLADAMAYTAHDIDDGLRAGLITTAQLLDVPLFAHWQAAVLSDHPGLEAQPKRLRAETLRRLLSAQVGDLVAGTQAALQQHRPADADAVRGLPPLLRFSDALHQQNSSLKRFLFEALYRHPKLVQATGLGRQIVADLHAAYTASPREMPADFSTAVDLPRALADYIAGMTDRHALREHRRLTGQRLFED